MNNNEVEKLHKELDDAFEIIDMFTEQAKRSTPAAYATLVIQINRLANIAGKGYTDILDNIKTDIEEIEGDN